MFSTRHSGGGSITIWGASSLNGMVALQAVQGRQKAVAAGIPSRLRGPRLCGDDLVFQQDNAAVHNARLTKDHPVCSPDQNPIENIWGWMGSWMDGKFQTVDALREAIFTTWSNVQTSLLETLASSTPQRIIEVIDKNGLATHY